LDKTSNIVEIAKDTEHTKTLKAWLLKEIAILYAEAEL